MIKKTYFMPLLCLICICTLFCCAAYSPAVKIMHMKGTVDEAAMDEHRMYLTSVIATLPENVSVSTQYNLLPLVSDRRQIWVDYSENADVILIDSAFPKRAKDFDDNIPEITAKFNLVLNNNNLFLYVNKNKPDLQAALQHTAG